jgi:hypothetical protein
MKFLIVSIYFFAMVMSSCTAQSVKTWKELKNPEVIALIDDYPLTHEEISRAENKILLTPFGMQALKYCGVFLVYEYTPEEFNANLMQIMETHTKLDSTLKIRILPREEHICEFDLVIPDPNHRYLFSDEDNFLENPEYFLFKAKEGLFANDEYLNYESNCPDQKHGYSSGAIVDRTSKKILYWMMIW